MEEILIDNIKCQRCRALVNLKYDKVILAGTFGIVFNLPVSLEIPLAIVKWDNDDEFRTVLCIPSVISISEDIEQPEYIKKQALFQWKQSMAEIELIHQLFEKYPDLTERIEEMSLGCDELEVNKFKEELKERRKTILQ